jgi:hypothetical protein
LSGLCFSSRNPQSPLSKEADHAQTDLFFVLMIALWPTSAHAQGDYGMRIPSRDGQWLLPVATRLLGSTDDDHVRRGSINSWDLSVSPGTPVFAAAPGTVKTVGCYLYEKKVTAVLQGYGCSVQVDHGNGIVSQYAHCKDVGFYVKVGDKVTANSLLCQSGQTGSASWPHVHFTILRNGGPVRIDSLFDARLMHYCHFTKCVANNRPSDPIRGYAVTGQQPATTATVAQTRYAQLLRILAQYPPQVVSLAIMAVLGLLVLIYWLGGKAERVAIVGGVSGMAGAAVIVWLMVPVGTVSAGQQTATIGDGTTWDKVYPIVQSMEGWSCTKDPIRTMGGVTQGTYSRWRAKKSAGQGHLLRVVLVAYRC